MSYTAFLSFLTLLLYATTTDGTSSCKNDDNMLCRTTYISTLFGSLGKLRFFCLADPLGLFYVCSGKYFVNETDAIYTDEEVYAVGLKLPTVTPQYYLIILRGCGGCPYYIILDESTNGTLPETTIPLSFLLTVFENTKSNYYLPCNIMPSVEKPGSPYESELLKFFTKRTLSGAISFEYISLSEKCGQDRVQKAIEKKNLKVDQVGSGYVERRFINVGKQCLRPTNSNQIYAALTFSGLTIADLFTTYGLCALATSIVQYTNAFPITPFFFAAERYSYFDDTYCFYINMNGYLSTKAGYVEDLPVFRLCKGGECYKN